MKTMLELKTKEQKRFNELEATIKSTRGAFVACGKALSEIRDNRLYRAEFPTFEIYCQKRWGWSKTHAYRLIQATEVKEHIESVSPIGDKILTESQARALAKIPKGKRARALRAASKNGELTAASITEAAEKITETIDIDETGYPIPVPALEYWNRSNEVTEILEMLSKIRSWAKNMQSITDKLWAETDMQSVYCDLNNAYQSIKLSVPYAVCSVCQGQAPQTCAFCKGRGVVSKFRWDTAVPQELKEIRSKSTKAA